MRSLWSDDEASRFPGLLQQRVYTSRLLGREPSLVLHGGGNTSVKIDEANLFGERERLLYVKGSGWDLQTIEPAGFSPVRLEHLLRLAQLSRLSDTEMAKELRVALTEPSAPSPSVEAILHGLLPHTFVDHTHADAVVTITNTPSGESRIREIYGSSVIVVPYVMPGFALAKACAERYAQEAHGDTLGMVLLNHGVFTFGGDARTSYERMIELVSRAEEYLTFKGAWHIAHAEQEGTGPAANRSSEKPLDSSAPGSSPPGWSSPEAAPAAESDTAAREGEDDAWRVSAARQRAALSAAAGRPMILRSHDQGLEATFASHPEIERISQSGPATPDHVLRTKRVPLIGPEVSSYAKQYREYFEAHARRADSALTMVDPAPRVIIEPGSGVRYAASDPAGVQVVEDIYRHTMEIILRAEALERYQALPAEEIFDVEYWDLEQAKLRRQPTAPVLAGEVAVVTGAASGIGLACARALLERGAAVVGVDLKASVEQAAEGPNFLGVHCDMSTDGAAAEILERAVRAYGGLDMLVLNAGVFPPSAFVKDLELEQWRRVMAVNLDANLELLRLAHPLLALAPNGGRVAVVGSKNVKAPGPGAASYSVSKAALAQLARVTAMEWGGDGIRVNVVHPDAVFDTELWTAEILEQRARHYGMSVEEYKRRNILKTEVASRDVAELVAEMCGPLFARTTGAQLPVDGGNERVI